MVTRGPEGVVVVEPAPRDRRSPPSRFENPVDICGAGDSFSAGAALALAVTGSGVGSGAVRKPCRFRHHHENRAPARPLRRRFGRRRQRSRR